MKTCIVVTGSGRSGTSMTMGLLSYGGLRHSENLIPASAQNPRGSFEDQEIFGIQRQMLGQMGPLTVPPPQDWLKHPAVQKALPELKAAVVAGIDGPQSEQFSQTTEVGAWGFKDPHAAYTLRLWLRIFNEIKATPRIVLCVRDPNAVVASMVRQYDMTPSVAELMWLTRNLTAIGDAAGDLFVAQFDKVISKETAHLNALFDFADLPAASHTTAADTFIDAKLDHSGVAGHICTHPCVLQLWDALKSCAGADFDRKNLLQTVNDINAELAHYDGWLNEIYRVYKNKQTLTIQDARPALLREKLAQEEKLVLAAQEIGRLQVHNQSQQNSIDDVVEEYRRSEANKSEQIATLKSNLIATRSSKSFQIGHILVNAVARPGRNTLAVPWRLVKVLLAGRANARLGR